MSARDSAELARALVFAPPPPPPGGIPGGIATITALLMRELGHRPDLLFASPLRKEEEGRFGLRRAVINLVRLAGALRELSADGTVLFFASSGLSFWEKCLWATLVRATGRRVAVVMVDGNFPRFHDALASPLRWLARNVFRGAGVTLAAQSPSWARYYSGVFPDTRIEIVSASVDREFFLPRSRRESAPVVRILYVGWIIEGKGVIDLLDAASLLARGARAFELRLVGPMFAGRERWHAEIQRRGLQDIAVLAGSMDSRADLLREYHAADIFVFPSHFEGFPVALLEAAALGLPCVGTQVGGIPDILDEGRAGLLVPARAPGALAAAVESLLGDERAREMLGERLREHAERSYTHEACAASYLRVLHLN